MTGAPTIGVVAGGPYWTFWDGDLFAIFGDRTYRNSAAIVVVKPIPKENDPLSIGSALSSSFCDPSHTSCHNPHTQVTSSGASVLTDLPVWLMFLSSLPLYVLFVIWEKRVSPWNTSVLKTNVCASTWVSGVQPIRLYGCVCRDSQRFAGPLWIFGGRRCTADGPSPWCFCHSVAARRLLGDQNRHAIPHGYWVNRDDLLDDRLRLRQRASELWFGVHYRWVGFVGSLSRYRFPAYQTMVANSVETLT